MSGVTLMMAGLKAPSAGSGVVQLFSRSRYELNIDPADSYAGFRLSSSGNEYYVSSTSLSWLLTGDLWLLSGAAADYDVYASLSGGDTPSVGTLDTWLNLGTSQFWYNRMLIVGSRYSLLAVQLATAADHGTILANCTVSLTAYVDDSWGGGGGGGGVIP